MTDTVERFIREHNKRDFFMPLSSVFHGRIAETPGYIRKYFEWLGRKGEQKRLQNWMGTLKGITVDSFMIESLNKEHGLKPSFTFEEIKKEADHLMSYIANEPNVHDPLTAETVLTGLLQNLEKKK